MIQMIKYAKFILIAMVLMTIPIISKFKPAYAVIVDNEVVGYVKNKEEFQKQVQQEVLTSDDEKVVFVTLGNIKYQSELIARNLLNEDETLENLKENIRNIYKVYEIKTAENEEPIYVNSLEEAEQTVNTLKKQYSKIAPDIKIEPIYMEEEPTEETIQVAKAKVEGDLNQKLEEKIREEKTINGICLACVPVKSGYISSRFGSRESIRNHVHKGIDIAAPAGTTIKAAGSGIIKSAGYNEGGYGNLIIIDHGNGVQTYYGHCSSINVTTGQRVREGEKIGAVGSTGNSTGNHLHFEVRLNGEQINPEIYAK